MRTYGRIWQNSSGAVVPPLSPGAVPTWFEVDTDANGFNDDVFVTALCQTLKLNLGESPFWADWGIPAKQAVVQQVFPDFYVALTQQRYAPRFASLTIAKVDSRTPTYNIAITKNNGAVLNTSVTAPQ